MDYTSNKHLSACLDHIKDMMIWIGSEGQLLHANASALNFYGIELESFIKLTIHDIDTNFPSNAWPQHWNSLKRSKSLTVTVQHRDKSGLYIPVEIIDNYQNIDGNEFSVCIIRAIENKHIRDKRTQLMEFSIDQMFDSALWINKDASIIFANDATCRNLGYAHDELLNMTIYDIDPKVTKDNWPEGWEKLKKNKMLSFETEHLKKDGHMLPVEVNLNFLKLYDEEINCAFVRDITERKLHEQQLMHVATHDNLTGLPNRASLYERGNHALLHAKRDSKHTAIILIDLDKFKSVNDNIGHDAGDEMLKVLSDRMTTILRETDTVARLGGDEFVILIDSIERPDDCVNIGEKLLQVITAPIIYCNDVLQPQASLGIAVYPIDGDNIAVLLKSADIAMYHSKRAGGNQYHFYKHEMGEQVSKYVALVKGLEQAIKENQFVLYYQPVFDMQSKKMVSAEALLRWKHPEGGLIPPYEFIPAAEESGLIVTMGEWVIQEVCQQNSLWKTQGLNIVPIAANLSVRQLGTDEIVGIVKSSLQKNNLPADYISLELTESMLMDDHKRIIQIITQFKKMGVKIAIDDFGTGYSSLSYLKQFPIDLIKIDRSFIKDIGGNNEDAIIANTIVTLAHGLGCKVLAEGVENEVQNNHMRNQGCDFVQGYYYSKPLPAKEFEKMLLETSSAQLHKGG